jgi:DNA polymerase III epsilon subunit-like protein
MKVVCIDIEASSLATNSSPIEIGVAWISDMEIKVRASLIRPRPAWSQSAWSPQSAAIHGVPRAALEAAPDA